LAHHDHGSHDHHGHAHDHGHDHHGHTHAPASFGRAFAIGIVLNTGFVVIEAVYGLLSHSLALLADAGHNLGDVLGLLVAWIAAVLARRAPGGRFTYGLGGSTILAALFNAVLLLVAVGAIAWEAIGRFGNPQPVAGQTVMIVAIAGILVNGGTAWLFASGRKGDINIRGAFTHMAADAAVSLVVVLAGVAIMATGWLWLDPATSLLVVVAIVWGTWGLLRDSVSMSVAAAPGHVDVTQVRAYLAGLPGVCAVHDLHVWPMSTTDTALTAHIVCPDGHPGDRALAEIAHELNHRFRIGHSTIQIELDPDAACALEPDHVI
jgi:cobalt-zinc-cadmium efflux system protein